MRAGAIVLVTIGVATLAAGAFYLGRQSAREGPPASARQAGAALGGGQTATGSRPAGAAALPAGHPGHPGPPLAAAAPRAGHPGASEPGPPKAHHPGLRFSQFKVGNRNIKALLADGDIVWVGTSGGVVRYDTRHDDHRLFDVRSGLLSNGVFHLSRLQGRLAVGTYGGGLSLLDPETEQWKNYNIQHGLADAFVYDLLETSNGDLWIATWSGANRVRGGRLDDREAWDTFTVANTERGLPNDWVYGLAEGPGGAIWLATEGGLARFQGGQWRHWSHADGLGADYAQVREQISFKRDPAKVSSHHARQKVEQGLTGVDVAYNPNYIVSLLADADGGVWAGTWGGGLAHFDGRHWRNYTVTDGLPADHVFMLMRDRRGRLWIGTSHGLARREGERFTVYGTADGLFAENVFSMAEAKDGSFWIGGFGGVAHIQGL